MAAAAGAGGGAPAAVSDADKVRGFMRLTGFRPSPDEPVPAAYTDEHVNTFLTILSARVLTRPNFRLIMKALPDFSDDRLRASRPSGRQGAYGAIRTCGLSPARCYKEVGYPYNNPEDVTAMLPEFFNFFKEAFIQYFLSQDATHGQNVPRLYRVFKRIQELEGGNQAIFFFIEMEFGDIDLKSALARKSRISFDDFSTFANGVLVPLHHFNRSYHFVHRDFKENNVVLARAAGTPPVTPNDAGIDNLLRTGTYKIIDFGLACILINGPVDRYQIKTDGRMFAPQAACRVQQDVLMFIAFFMEYFGNKSEANLVEFLNGFLPRALNAQIRGRMRKPPQHGNYFKASYNHDGTLLAAQDFQAQLGIPNFLRELNEERVMLDNSNGMQLPAAAAAAAMPPAVRLPPPAAAGGAAAGMPFAVHLPPPTAAMPFGAAMPPPAAAGAGGGAEMAAFMNLMGEGEGEGYPYNNLSQVIPPEGYRYGAFPTAVQPLGGAAAAAAASNAAMRTPPRLQRVIAPGAPARYEMIYSPAASVGGIAPVMVAQPAGAAPLMVAQPAGAAPLMVAQPAGAAPVMVAQPAGAAPVMVAQPIRRGGKRRRKTKRRARK